VAFGILTLGEHYQHLTAAELRERQEFLAENTVRSRARSGLPEMWERLGVDLPTVRPYLLEAAAATGVRFNAGFQRGFWAKLVPNVRKLGFWMPTTATCGGSGRVRPPRVRVRRRHCGDYELYDAVAADRAQT